MSADLDYNLLHLLVIIDMLQATGIHNGADFGRDQKNGS
jgi:hypothetical protein